MLRTLTLVTALAILLPAKAAFAITAKQKMETCKFGADDQKLKGAKRKTFIARCMAEEKSPPAPPAAKP